MYLKPFIRAYLSNGFDFNEAKTEISFLLEVLFNYTYKDFLLNKTLEEWQINKVQKIIDERTNTKKPIQQIVGRAFFFGRVFFVNENTLIPRPETELLVNEVLKLSQSVKNPEILDICTGTGCIGLTLMLENSNIKADLSDIQPQAIELAKKNALFYNISGINFIKSDLFDNIQKKYDIIVSNPPYIPLREKKNLQIEVRKYESPIALYTKDEYGIEFYEKIIIGSKQYLKENGKIAFELGINQVEKVSEILENNGYSEINAIKDFNKIDRVITAVLTQNT